MSPSLESSVSHGGHSNISSTSVESSPNHIPDAPPMFSSSLFQSAIGVSDVLSKWDDMPVSMPIQAPARWSMLGSAKSGSSSSERLPGISVPTPGQLMTGFGSGSGAFCHHVTPRIPAYGHIESPFALSPSSSVNSNDSKAIGIAVERPSARALPCSLYEAFLSTHSRVVKVRKYPNASFLSLRSIFDLLDRASRQVDCQTVGPTWTIWSLKDTTDVDEVWVVFKSHRDACVFLSFSLPSFASSPALEVDLEPFEKIRRLDLFAKFPSPPVIQPERLSHKLRMSISTPDLHKRVHFGHPSFETQPSYGTQPDHFVISSNPPNPKTTFRLGDWICNSITCAAHNFGRNLACRGCGCPRSENQASSMNRQGPLGASSNRFPASPRFAGAATPPFHSASPIPNQSVYPTVHNGSRHLLAPQPPTAPKPASPSHPLLTPSGRSFSVGGKVQNISSEPTTPCIMYWPDNEPFPEQGQIRPSSLSGVPQPPILNTGNRGPIEHQPGDWICGKCNYLNWRRRKVCQTCYPYAEGNGDSISAAVQAERISLLTSLLTQNQLPLRAIPTSSPDIPRRHTVTQMSQQRIPEIATPSSRPFRPQFDVGCQYPDSQFIYETSGPHRSSLPSFPTMRDLGDALPAQAPAPLLPSFLQNIVQSPTLSPTSTSSADLSVEECEDFLPSGLGRDQVLASNDSSSHLPIGNIWRLNDEETASIAGIALPHHEDLIGNGKSNQELLRRPSS